MKPFKKGQLVVTVDAYNSPVPVTYGIFLKYLPVGQYGIIMDILSVYEPKDHFSVTFGKRVVNIHRRYVRKV